MRFTRAATVTIVFTMGCVLWSGCSDDSNDSGDANGNGNNGNPPSIRRVTTHLRVDGSPAVSPDGVWIAFYSERAGTGQYRLWRVPFVGGTEEQLTTEYATSPRYSPDSTFLYFSSNRSGGFALYRMPAAGGAATLIPEIPSSAELSPDGQWWVYSATDTGFFDNRIWKRRADLSEPAVMLTTPEDRDFTPAWSPAGDQIVFARGDPNDTNDHLYVMNADGSGLRPLTDTTKDVEDWAPAWSPNGEWIVFERGGIGVGEEKIFKVRATGETANEPAVRLTWVTAYEDDDGNPCWSPDGKWIVFESHRDGNIDVYVMSVNGEPKPTTSRVRNAGVFGP